ncbi:MAG: phage tail protein [Acholeplasmataceae bacterium]|jgi:hypothetical protein|nr:phage tail protein [Acholeplasmataceae bacterium]
MTTAAIVWAGSVYIGAAGTGKTASAKIGEVLDADFQWDLDMVEVTSRDSDGHKEYLPANDGGAVTVSCNYLKGDTSGQTALAGYFAAKTKIALRVNWDDAGSNNGYGRYCDGWVKSMPVSASQGDKVNLKFTFQPTGVITDDFDSV